MADVQSYLDQILGNVGTVPVKVDTPVPAQVVPNPADAAAIAAAAADGNTSVLLNTARDRGNTLATDNAILADYENPDISSLDFLAKYGPNVTADMQQVSLGKQTLNSLQTDTRSSHLADNASSAVTGLVGSVGDAATMIAGALNRDAGRYASDSTETFRNWMSENTQSDENTQNVFASSMRAELDSMDNNKQYEKDIKDGDKSSFMAGLSYLGRGIVDGASRFVEDPASLETGIATAAGSLLAGGPIAKSVSIAGKLAGLGKIATTAAMPAAIGMMEGGSAYTGALQEVKNMPIADLLAMSPTFRQLVADGMDPEKARDQVAAQAAEIAAVIQAPLGAAAGKLVSKFEANPLGSKGFKDMVRNILTETVEEGSQSVTGQVAQNAGLQVADPNKSLLQDVGDQGVQGALLGSLSAGIIQAPSIPKVAVTTALNKLKESAAKINTANVKESGVAKEDIIAASEDLTANIEPLAAAVDTLAAAVPEEVKQNIEPNLSERVRSVVTANPDDVASFGQNSFEYLKATNQTMPKNKIGLIVSAASLSMDQQAPEDVRRSSAMFLIRELDRQQKVFGEDLEDIKDNMDQSSTEYDLLKQYQSMLDLVAKTPETKAAMDAIKNSNTVDLPEDTVVDDGMVSKAITAVTSMPSAITAKTARTILKQSEDGKGITELQRKALLQTADALDFAAAGQSIIDEANKEANHEPATQAVSEQIMRKGGKADYMLSVDQHLARVNRAIIENNPAAATNALKHMAAFANSQRNKAVAAMRSFNEAIKTNKKGVEVEFPRLGSNGRINPTKGKITIYPGNANSLALARQVFIEANVLADQVNSLAASNPELGINPVERVPLPQEFFGKMAQDQAGKAQQSEPEVKEPVAPVKTETAPVTKPEPKTQVAPFDPADIADEQLIEDLVKRDASKEFSASEQIKTLTITERFTKLVSDRFTQAFGKTKRFGAMLNREKPLIDFINSILEKNTAKSVIEFVGDNPSYDVTPSQLKALRTYLIFGNEMISDNPKDMKEGEQSLRTRLISAANTVYGSKNKDIFLDKLKNGEDIVGTRQGKAFALLQKSETGFGYNPTLIQTAMLAALDWFASSENRIGNMDKKDISELTGVDMSEITPEQEADFKSSVALTNAVRSLAQNIQTFWGMEKDKDIAENQVLGIAEGIAKEILNVMLSRGLMATKDVKMSNNNSYTQFYFGENIREEVRDLLIQMGPAKKLIELASVREEDRETVVSYNAPITKVKPTQMRNKFTKLARTQQRVAKKAQAIAHNYYANSHDMINKIGKKGMIELGGGMELTKDTQINASHRKSIEGLNLTIGMSFDAANEQLAELVAHAETLGEADIQNVNKFYAFAYNSVNRLQMLGSFNPQASKLLRHIFLPTKRTVDLSDPNSAASLGFFMAINQGLDQTKVQQFTNEENAAQGRALVETGIFAPLVQELQEWLKNGKEGDLYEWSQKARQVFPGISGHGIMSLLSAAEYYNATDLTNFTTHNYFEADGVTNGPANALMNLTTEITAEWVATVRKVGAFIGYDDKSMVDQKNPDLYKTAAILLGKIQRNAYSKYDKKTKSMHDSLFNIMKAIGMDITITENGIEITNIDINRKVLKNPLTITIYGAGVSGISNNVTGEIMTTIYSEITKHLQGNKDTAFGNGMLVNGKSYSAEQFWSDFENLTNNVVIRNKDGDITTFRDKNAKASVGVRNSYALKGFEVAPEDFKLMSGNIKTLFIENMISSIDNTVMTHVKGMVGHIQKATNAQSIVLHYMFRKELMKEMAKRVLDPVKYNYKNGDFLSQNELEEILRRLLPFGAVINTEHQSYFFGSGERTDVMESVVIALPDNKSVKVNMPSAFALSLSNNFKTPAYTFGPRIAGVAGVPGFNIGTGDGRMIDVFLDRMSGFGVLPVFDGINLPIDKIIEGSKLANEAVFTSWTENPARHAADSFTAFLRQNPLERMFDKSDPFNVEMEEFSLDLTKNLTGLNKVDYIYAPEEHQKFFELLNTQLETGAVTIQNRQDAMKNFNMSTDQMAGGNNPHVNKGTVVLPANPTVIQIAQALEFEANRIGAIEKKDQAIAGPSNDFINAIKNTATLDIDSGAYSTNIAGLDAIRKTLNSKMSNDNKELLNAAIKSLKNISYTVVFGSPEAVDRFEQNHFPNTHMDDGSSFLGKIDVANKVIYITNPSLETMTHELLHAATITKMKAYYADKNSVSSDEGAAIKRLDGLMREWLYATYEREAPIVAAAHRMAASAIHEKLRDGKTAEAVNEFIAWGLTNQNISRIMKKTLINDSRFKIIGTMIQALKNLFKSGNRAPALNDSMFSNVKFNTRVLMAEPTTLELFEMDFEKTVLFQSTSFGSNSRLSDVRQRFGEHIFGFVNELKFKDDRFNKLNYEKRRSDAFAAIMKYIDITNRMAVPFHMNMQQLSTFKMIGATLSVAEHLNAASMVRFGEIFDRVITKISPDDFKTNTGDPQADEYQAQEKYNALTNADFGDKDSKGRATLIPNFIALSMVDEQFREILRKIDMPIKIMDKSWKLDALMDRAGNATASALAMYASGQGRENIDMQAAMDALTQNLIENVGDQRSFIEQRIDGGLDKADSIIKTYIEKGVKKITEWGETVKNPKGKKVTDFLVNLAKMTTEEGFRSVVDAQVKFFNQPGISTDIREAVAEVVGRTKDNAPVFDMITRVRTFVDQTRQHWREEFPKELRKRFAKPLSEQQWADLHHGLGKTDAASLWKTYRTKTLDLLSSGSERKAEIAKLEANLSIYVRGKAEQLANYMVTGEPGLLLQPNAYAIAVISNMQENEQDIDNLVTLYAIEKSADSVKNTLVDVIKNDKEGITKIFHSLVATYNDEKVKTISGKAKMNGLKGHLLGQNQEGVHMLIADRLEHAKLISMGYVDMGDYKGSTADVGTQRKSYYYAPVSGKPTFNQGVMQTVQQSYFGVNPETGFSVGQMNAGHVTDSRAVAAITRRINSQIDTSEQLKPIYNEDGLIVAYERMADPMKLTHLNPTFDLSKSMSIWRGRQSEELASKAVNQELVDNLLNIYQKGKLDNRMNEFVRVDKSTDPIIADAWGVIPQETKDYIKSVFGKDGFMVRKEMMNDAIGSRSASIGDFWTGNSRWSPAVQKEIKNAIVGLIGNKGYNVLVNAENFIQSSVTDAKILIVVKSMIVPAANLISTIYQLSMNGVPFRHIFTGLKQKTYELNTYIKMKENERQIQNDLYAAEGADNSAEIRRLSTRLQIIQDGYKSMSIHPLIEAGEFGGITDGDLSEEDLAMSKGGYGLMIEKLVHKLPDDIKDFGRYGLITRDTALFKVLSRATQYGDFLGKATLYDDLTIRKKMSSKEALAYINEEFVNYNRFAGRSRAYGESMGIFWFHNFKIRSMKIAQRMIQNHPVRALLHSALQPHIPLLGSVGNILTDNMLSIIMRGRLGYSIGPDQLLRAPQLNPWLNLTE